MVRSTGTRDSNSTVAESEIEFLYKYRELSEANVERVERIFANSELYFASPKQFNDPFDSKVLLSLHGTKEEWRNYLRQLYKNFRPHWNREQRFAEVELIMREGRYKRIPKDAVNSYLDEIGVFSMSERNDHILMWSHYSKNHTGFCLEFKATSDTSFFGRALKVEYAEDYPEVNFFRSSRDEQMKTVLLTKAKLWEYEQEWLIIDYETGSGVYTFQPDLLTGVIIGCQMSDKKKEKIHSWVKNREPQPNLTSRNFYKLLEL